MTTLNVVLIVYGWNADVAESSNESANMIQVIGKKIGFEITGHIEVFETDPIEPPKENPYGYDIKLTPYD